MNDKISRIFLLSILVIFFAAFRAPLIQSDVPAAFVSPTTLAKDKYIIASKESVVTWKGSMALGNGEHIGYVSISKGEFIMDKSQLVGGSVVLDMTTITDKDHGSDNNLVNHLKDPDFFDVKQFPISVFVITSVAPPKEGIADVTGNLTIKGITNPITFPAKLDVTPGSVTATANIAIDRTKWDVRYKSGKFFTLLADEAIADDIKFDLKVVAKK